MQDILIPSSAYSSFKHSLKLRFSHYHNHGGVKVPQMSLHKAIAGPKSHFPSKPGKKRDLKAKLFSGRLPSGLLTQRKGMTDK
ncbi:hypothetical protein CDAR_619481 [Caerostris darwini]|uniref:Uncharacterized protein n=1 Tax=Caerostris darwini TaxID=1538125 RepID=A0AAV4TTD1_9ARAC|nr:hypothetical protein CDAR_619481 [Caerostris darwini]